MIGVRVETSTPQFGAKVWANSESAGFLAFGPPTSLQSPSYALMYWRAMQARPGLLERVADLLAVLLLFIAATSSSAGLSVTLSVCASQYNQSVVLEKYFINVFCVCVDF